MYDSLIETYRVIYEGATAPIFYKRFYPTHVEDANPEHNDYREYVWGLKSDCGSYDQNYSAHAREYDRDLRDLLDRFVGDTKGLRRGVVVIPSSTKGKVNRVTDLVRKVVGSEYASAISDLTRHFRRARSKEKAHLGGTRSTAENMDTLMVDPDGRVQCYGAILVLDDITTSGNSFLSADAKLREAGFGGMIVNFAFARTCPSEGVELLMRWEAGDRLTTRLPMSPQASPSTVVKVGYRVSFPDGSTRDFEGGFNVVEKARHIKRTLTSGTSAVEFDSRVSVRFEGGQTVEFDSPDDFKQRVKRITRPRKIESIVFDLDDTLVSDTPRDFAYEEYLRRGGGGAAQGNAAVPCPYGTYPGVRDFMSLGIPFAILSNRPMWEIRRVVDDPVINDSIYPGRMAREKQVLEEWRSSGGRFYPPELLRGTGTEQNQHENLFSYPSRRVNGYDKPARLYKPCPQGVLQAVRHLRSASRLEDDARIVGVGNTLDDIIAYKAAGIESVLALWGVPDYLREHAERHWGADRCFRSMAEFGAWCVCGTQGGNGSGGAKDVGDGHGNASPEQRPAHKPQGSGLFSSKGKPSGRGASSDSAPLPKDVIQWWEAEGHIGETVSIYGKVKSTHFDWEDYERFVAAYQMGAEPKPTYIKVGGESSDKRSVNIVIWGRDRGKFKEPPDSYYKGKSVIFTGRPYVDNGTVTVRVSDPKSIRVVKPIDDAGYYDSEGRGQVPPHLR